MTHPLLRTNGALAMAFVAGSLIVAYGCGDETGGTTNPVAPTSNTTTPTSNTTTPPSNNTTPVATATLERVGMQSRAMNANSSLTLEVLYKDASGTPTANIPIAWNIVGESNGTLLDAQQSVTEGDGKAKMNLRAATMEANFDVEVSVANNADIPAVRFTVNVQSKDFASYRIVVDYDGHRVYSNNNIKVALFQDLDCEDANPLRLVGAFRTDQRKPESTWPPMSFSFDNLANGTTYTAVAVAFADGNDQVVGSWGCNDDRPAIVDGQNPPDVVVNLEDLLPNIAGTWEIESAFDLTEAVPANVLSYLDPILNFFSDPAGVLTTLLFDFLEDQGLSAGAIEDLVQGIASDLVNQLIMSNDTISNILNAGGDIGDILRNFRLRGTATFENDMINPNGIVENVAINYTQFGYRWRLLCEDGEEETNPSCGESVVDFGSVGLSPANGEFDATIITNTDYNLAEGRIWFHQLAIQDHSLDLNYGQIILFLIEKLALPALTGNPSIDSLSALLQSFIDCDELTDPGSLTNTLCDSAIREVSNLATDFLSEQSLQYDRFVLKTPGTSPCPLYEPNDADYGSPQGGNTAHNPRFKFMGKNETFTGPPERDLRCDWEANIQFSDDPTNNTSFTGKFFATKSFE